MHQTMILIIIFSLLTVLSLIFGILSMTLGKEFKKKYSTKLMYARVTMQALVIILLLVMLYD